MVGEGSVWGMRERCKSGASLGGASFGGAFKKTNAPYALLRNNHCSWFQISEGR